MTRLPDDRRIAGIVLAVCLLPCSAAAIGWNGEGHMTVAAVAWKDMTPAACGRFASTRKCRDLPPAAQMMGRVGHD
jgi:hypothetical protein